VYTDMKETNGKEKGGCKLCGGVDDGKRLAVDHCHKSGRVRGLLCGNCNHKIVGAIENADIDLEALVEYLS
jgi:hypothetical protein